MIPEGAFDYRVWGVAGLTMVMLIMQVVKAQWPELKDRGTVWVAIGVALVLAIIAKLYELTAGTLADPPLKIVLDTIGSGLIVGFGAGGFWSMVKPRPQAEEEADEAEEQATEDLTGV